jgi:GT2 family glycosyltransferase
LTGPEASIGRVANPAGIAVVVLTHNRVHLLKQCVERVLGRTSERTCEIVIWDNASDDGTAAFLDSLTDPRLQVVRHPKNIGPSAYDLAIAKTTSEYIVELDDDIIDAPDPWDELLLTGFERLQPEFGLLAANLVDNPHDLTAQIMYGPNAHLYSTVDLNGLELKVGGPIGGGCAITSRATWARVGGFGRNRRLAYWSSDNSYMDKLDELGFKSAYLNTLQVLHAGGEYYAPIPPAKREFWKARARRAARRNAVKRAILLLPFASRLNRRYAWFVPPGLADSSDF